MYLRDFERIVAEIAPETTIQMDEIDQMGPRIHRNEPIWIAEDSKAINILLKLVMINRSFGPFSLFTPR